MRRLLLAMTPLLLLLAACHTVQGAKEDLSAASQAIANTAHKLSQKLQQ